MKLSFIGAAHEVTGSCHLLEACGKTILVDYGMEQGLDLYPNVALPVEPGDIDLVLLTHAHVDHSGMLPVLYKHGFRGKIFATEATADLSSILLLDSAHIQESEAERKNRKGNLSGNKTVQPVYTLAQTQELLKLFVPLKYQIRYKIAEGIEIRFTDVGHLLGSSAIEVWLTEGKVSKKIVFSGDIGNVDQPILRDPQFVSEADYLLIESTYGDRLHGEVPDYVSDFAGIIQKTFDRGGNVVIPAFAVGRVQEVLYVLREIKERGLIKRHEGFEVYVDSPLAVEVTSIFDKHGEQCYDKEAETLLRCGIHPVSFPGMHLLVTSEESKEINSDMRPKVILATSGMCEAGRIRHHLKHNLWRPECTILFVGYQSKGTLGRELVDGAEEVDLFGEPVEVRSNIVKFAGVSGHADRDGLLRWLEAFQKKPDVVFVVHGEDKVTDTFAALIKEKYEIEAVAPYSGDRYDLSNGKKISKGE